jgi:hypothetical protein
MESVKVVKKKLPRGGSRKGIPNKATKALKDMILGALSDAGGQDYLTRQAEENPSAFMQLIGKVLPSELQVSGKDGGEIKASIDVSKLSIDALREIMRAKDAVKQS